MLLLCRQIVLFKQSINISTQLKKEMKKNLLLLIAFVCCITVFTSCEDDKKETTPPAVAGTWNLPKVVFGEDADKKTIITSTPIHMIWDAPEGTELVEGFPVAQVPFMVQGMIANSLLTALKDITLHENGDISATYSDAEFTLFPDPEKPIEWKNSGTGYATYKQVSATQIKIFLNLKKIVGEDPKDVAAMEEIFKAFPALKTMVTDGIPVSCTLSADKRTCRVFVDKAFVMQFMPMLELILPTLPDELKPMVAGIPEIMKVTTKFEIGLNLIK